MEQLLRYKHIYDETLPLVKILENKLFRHRPEARQARHAHPSYLYEWTYIFLNLKSVMLSWKFADALPLLAHFSKETAEKPKIEISVAQLLIITNIHNLPLDICFWWIQIGWYLLTIIHISISWGRLPKPPPVALRALPYPPPALHCVASHRFAPSCSTQQFSSKKK